MILLPLAVYTTVFFNQPFEMPRYLSVEPSGLLPQPAILCPAAGLTCPDLRVQQHPVGAIDSGVPMPHFWRDNGNGTISFEP